MDNFKEKDLNLKNIENKILLQKLKQEIEENFWIEEKDLKELIKSKTSESIELLKVEMLNKNKNFWKEKINELFEKINEIKQILKENSQNEIEKLKKQVEESINVNNFTNDLEKYLPRKLLKVAKNPEKPHEHLIWASLWIANSTFAAFETIAKIWVWIIKTPYDLYLLASWKWELKNIKKV